MSLHKFIANYSAYNYWANKRITNWLNVVPQEYLFKQVPSSFNTIDYTLQHILRAQKFWLAFVMEQDVSNFNWAVRENEVALILSELDDVSLLMKEKFSVFSDDALQQTLHLNMPWLKNSLSRYEYIVHVINHSSYHRGQVITIARSVGIQDGFVNTDYNFFNSAMQ